MSPQFKYFIALLIPVFIFGCESEVKNVTLPEFEQKLVITSFISPSDTISDFLVSSNMKIFGELNTEEPLGELTGFISDGVNEVRLDTTRTGFRISSDKMKIQYGTTYNLRVYSDKGLSINASSTVPERRNFIIEVDTFSTLSVYNWYMEEREINLKVSVQDIPGEENFYRVTSKIVSYDSYPDGQGSYQNYSFLPVENEFFTDAGFNGGKIIKKTRFGINYFYQQDSAFAIIYLMNLEKPYFLYHKSLSEYNGSDNPFSESVPVFSNITDGLGIFSSYTVDSLIYRIK